MADFVDTRLHVVVRPPLEYLLPEACTAVCSVLVGDYEPAHAYAAIDAVARLSTARPREAEDDDDDDELAAACAAASAAAAEYLQALATAWRTHTDGIARGARLSVQRLTEDANRADNVCRMYRSRNPDVVAREHRAELARLHEELRAARTALRERAPPVLQRPEELVRAAETCKALFGHAYGRVPTARLLARKRKLERSLHDLQMPIAEASMTHLRRLLAAA